ncbi:hypothetical protein SAMN05421823_102389 [Catalinimonas alkaloidigena]|uniref:ABC transporter ATPase n=1 Tax=Catalinimonas alkaloidigena TaxID=1075417 RepID=A0A1G9ARL5_9BACT|nr:hypothetical protein [Catalinimonas alkaloidigena]SDK29893.1 hypothetical protein SAMN05421823_102389 [Catalinimonas alkaloidigena]
MHVSFDQLPDTARLWVYQANRAFSPAEQQTLTVMLTQFCEQWAAHSQPLQASFRLVHDQFIVLAVDERYHAASGCSIDASVQVIRQLEQQLGISLLDRSQVAYLTDEGVQLVSLANAKALVTDGVIQPETPVFNNAVASLGDWRTSWEIPASQSWMKRFFASRSVV